MPPFTLPDGYSFADGTTTLANVSGYGGADVSNPIDATGAEWVFCCANGPGDPKFRFRAFRRRPGESAWIEMPLPTVSTGRGNADVQWIDGMCHYIAWEGTTAIPGVAPDFAPFPSIPSLASRIAVLEQTGGGGGSGGFTLLPAAITPTEWSGRTLTGPVTVDVPSVFGVPAMPKYLFRLGAVAPLPNVRARVGTEACPYFLTANTQAPNLEIHIQGWAPGPSIYVSPVNGSPTIWLQVLGW